MYGSKKWSFVNRALFCLPPIRIRVNEGKLKLSIFFFIKGGNIKEMVKGYLKKKTETFSPAHTHIQHTPFNSHKRSLLSNIPGIAHNFFFSLQPHNK